MNSAAGAQLIDFTERFEGFVLVWSGARSHEQFQVYGGSQELAFLFGKERLESASLSKSSISQSVSNDLFYE